MRGPSKRGRRPSQQAARAGGPTTKIHVIVDALGNPLALRLTGGQVHDITQAEALAAEAQPEALLGDKGYDADAFIESLEGRAIKPVIPPSSNRKVARDCDFALYAERNLIERFFPFIKQFRGIATLLRHPAQDEDAMRVELAMSPAAERLGRNRTALVKSRHQIDDKRGATP